VPRAAHRPIVAAVLATWCLFLLPSALAADGARLLLADRDAAEARVELVLGAREELLASAFIFGDDPFTLTSLALLRDASRRGIDVKLLIDAQWNKMPEAVAAHLLEEGVEIRLYHPFRWTRPQWITRRLHDKLAIADGERLITGGRNVESPYFGYGHQLERRNYIDADVLVTGDAAAESRAYFLELWESGEVAASRALTSVEARAEASALLDRHGAWLEERVVRALADPERVPVVPAEVGEVRFLHDPVGKKGEAPGVGHDLLDLLDGARESVVIESPYLVPSRALRRGLRRALDRGVAIRILTNSVATTDNLWPQAGYDGKRDDLVGMGVELWELSGEATNETLHTKAAVIDGRTVIVGSYNLDPRSEHLNTEVAVVLEDPALAAELTAWMDGHLEVSDRIGPRGWPEGAEEPFPGVGCWKKTQLRLLQLLAPFVKRQL
jgi:putative cardiolipin synthase